MGIERLSLEDVVSVCILMFFGMAGAIPGIAPNQASEMTGVPASGLMFVTGIGSQLLVNAAIALLALRHAPQLYAHLRTLRFAGALAILAVCSAAWSQDPVLSERRAVPFALATIFALYLAVRHPLRRTLALLEIAFVLLAIGSAVLALGFPPLGLDASTGHHGDWQGVFTQKNACGRAMVFATAVVLAQGKVSRRGIASLTIFAIVLGMSGSRGAWAIEALLLSVAACHRVLCRCARPSRFALAASIAIISAGLGIAGRVYFPAIATLMGRDPTLTGRTAIWRQVWIEILKRPWLGYGFSAFWRGTKGASFEVVVALKFVLFHAHNGFLEIWLELGLAGLMLFILSYFRGWRRLWPLLLGEQGEDSNTGFAASAWPVYLLILIAAYDFDENTLLSFNGLFWVLYVHALASMELAAPVSQTLPREDLAPLWPTSGSVALQASSPSGELADRALWF